MKICAYSTCNESYIQNSITSLLSLRKWNKDIDLFIISKTLSNSAKELADKHRIEVVEIDLSDHFSKHFEYPIECYYLFAGPEYFLLQGYDYSVYIDGDIYCNATLKIDWSKVEYFAGVSIGSIYDLLSSDIEKIFSIWGIREIPKHRVQTGVLLFNNSAMSRVSFLQNIAALYSKSILHDIPRKGDDSLFSLFQLLYPEILPFLLSDDFNFILPKIQASLGSKAYLTEAAERINTCTFFHFTNQLQKPWNTEDCFSCYVEKYFTKKWRNCFLDFFDRLDIQHYFPDFDNFLLEDNVRFYWWGKENVGDILTPYYLQKVCQTENPEQFHISEEAINKQRQFTSRFSDVRSVKQKLAFLAKRIKRQTIQKQTNLRLTAQPKKIIISTGSIMRLCSPGITVYGSGIRSQDQSIGKGNIEFVRGPITREALLNIGCECPPIYGDPGLLISRYHPPKEKRFQLGIIPHFTEYAEIAELYKEENNALVINMASGEVETTIDKITSCDRIVSSSLHGIVFANSYSIPVRWIKFSDRVFGDDTKFKDHFLSIGRENETYINAMGFQHLSVEYLLDAISDYEITIDLDKLQDAIFFNENGLKGSLFWRAGEHLFKPNLN